eukprot:TRINITY_DN3976_c0_g1_i1.p1 TRINITY_DN3976_c0_g1~~TRINITY_DN3976_c0_g1_i1.p1  ORF type:complete len:958 (+),score=190.54 TRINITY_DN3976_c0_g1_i1:318-2876(+)
MKAEEKEARKKEKEKEKEARKKEKEAKKLDEKSKKKEKEKDKSDRKEKSKSLSRRSSSKPGAITKAAVDEFNSVSPPITPTIQSPSMASTTPQSNVISPRTTVQLSPPPAQTSLTNSSGTTNPPNIVEHRSTSYNVLPSGPTLKSQSNASRTVQAPRRASTKLQSDFLGKLESTIEKRKSLGPDSIKKELKGLSVNDWREKELEKEKQKEVKEGKTEEEKKERVATISMKSMDLNADELAAFSKAGEKPGLEVWKIEKMIPERVEKSKYGKFFAGDSYICLQTEFQGRTRNLQYNLFYWIGRKAPPDSVASVAFRSVQLSEKLGGGAVHHREEHGHESETFSELFNSNIKYLKGGSESALNHVADEKYETRLLQLLINAEGTASTTMVEMKADSLNEEDCFILDSGFKIWVWVGGSAGLVKLSKGTEMAYMINAENKSKGDIIILKGEKREKKSAKVEEFWKLLGGRPSGEVSVKANPDRVNEFIESVMLYEVCLVEDTWETVPIEDFPLRKQILKTDECYILDASSEIFIWCGKNSNFDKKNNAMLLAEDTLAMVPDRPSWTPLTRISEGNELVLFKSKFVDWYGKDIYPVRDFREIELKRGRVAAIEPQSEIVMEDYFKYQFPEIELENVNPDPDSGSVEIWKIDSESTEAEGVADSEFGVFSDTSSYIVLYTYTERAGVDVKGVIFFWDGNRASTKNWMIYESKFHDVLVKKMQEEGVNKPHVKIRVNQGEEKEVFMSCFEGLILLNGYLRQQKKAQKLWRVFVITGESRLNLRMTEIDIQNIVWSSKTALVFIKCDPKEEQSGAETWLWRGIETNDWEKNFILTEKNEERPFIAELAQRLRVNPTPMV